MKSALLVLLLSLLPQLAFSEDSPALTAPFPSAAEDHPWLLKAGVAVPFRGFQLETSDPKVLPSLKSFSYMPSPSLEGSAQIAYQGLGFRYDRTLAAASLDSKTGAPASVSEEARFDFLFYRMF